MSPPLVFGLLLLVSFAGLALLLRRTRPEEDIARHLSRIGGLYTVEADGATILRREVLSAVPWVNDLLLGLPATRGAQRLIQQSGAAGWTVGQLLLLSLTAGWLLGGLGAMLDVPLAVAAAAGLAAAASPTALLALRRASRFRRFEAVLPEAVDLMARALRAGHGVNSMIEMVAEEVAAPAGGEFRILFDEQRLGLPLREAMLNFLERVPVEDMRALATAILVQKETGGNLAEILDKTGQLMRDRQRLRGQLRIYTAQGRLTGWMLGSLPFALFLLMNFLNHDYEQMLWTTALGRDLLYAGLGLVSLGAWTISRIVNIRV